MTARSSSSRLLLSTAVNEAKGYARGEDDYIILTDDDLDAVQLDTVKTIDINKFVPADSIEWVYLEKPHYLMPDDAVGNEAFAVIRDAMKSDNVVGVSKLVMGRRERARVAKASCSGHCVSATRFARKRLTSKTSMTTLIPMSCRSSRN